MRKEQKKKDDVIHEVPPEQFLPTITQNQEKRKLQNDMPRDQIQHIPFASIKNRGSGSLMEEPF